MQIGANLWIWESPVGLDAIQRRAPVLKSWGFDIAELPYEAPGSWDGADARCVIDDNGLTASVCIAMSPDRDLTTLDRGTVQRTQDYLRRAIEAAAIVGSSAVGGPIYSPTGRTGVISSEHRSELLHRLAENLRPVLDDAHSSGVRLAIEPLNRFETSLFNTVVQTIDLLDLIDDPDLGILLDTFHMNIEEVDIPAAIRLAGARLLHFHACGNDRGAPGNGSIPWPAIVGSLRDIGYEGGIVIESFVGTNQVIAAAASIWRPLAMSQDAIATDGLTFLRGVLG